MYWEKVSHSFRGMNIVAHRPSELSFIGHITEHQVALFGKRIFRDVIDTRKVVKEDHPVCEYIQIGQQCFTNLTKLKELVNQGEVKSFYEKTHLKKKDRDNYEN